MLRHCLHLVHAALLLPLMVWLSSAQPAQPEEKLPEQTEVALKQLLGGDTDLAVLIEALPLVASDKYREKIRAVILTPDKAPRSQLVALLDHPFLTLRLAALDFLEEMASTDHSFDPWAPAESPENQAALARWKKWAGEPLETKKRDGIYSDEQRATYLRDLLAANPDQSLRASRFLASEGFSGLAFLERHLTDHPQLPPAQRLKVRETQYLISLQRAFGKNAPLLARHLAFGNRDQVLSALAEVRTSGATALPIINDFLRHSDPLIRETAYDSLLVAGEDAAIPTLSPLLLAESDPNVIHGALRRLKDVKGKEAQELVSQFLTHQNEDVLVSAIQTALTQSGSNSNFYSFGSSSSEKKSPADKAILAALADPRWRVRAAALEFVNKRRVTSAADACLPLLKDQDDFVRNVALATLSNLKEEKALPIIKKMFLEEPSLAGPTLKALANYEKKLENSIIEKLRTYPAQARIEALSIPELAAQLAPEFANDPNADLACAALRALAANSQINYQPKIAATLLAALNSGDAAKRDSILDSLSLDDDKIPSSQSATTLHQLVEENLTEQERQALDSLYQEFLQPKKSANLVNPTLPAGQPDPRSIHLLIEKIASFAKTSENPALAYQAALALCKIDHSQGFLTLAEKFSTLTPAQKSDIAGAFYSTENPDAAALIKLLLTQPVAELRQRGAYFAFSGNQLKLHDILYQQLLATDSPLQASEAYSYQFNEHFEENENAKKLLLPLLQHSDPAHQILALIAIQKCKSPSSYMAQIQNLAASPSPLLRRAAYRTWKVIQPTTFFTNAEKIAADPDARVRQALTSAYFENPQWTHYFSDVASERDDSYSYSYGNRRKSSPTPDLPIFTKLSQADPSPIIRLEASLALLAAGQPVDVDTVIAHYNDCPDRDAMTYFLIRWINDNASRLTAALAPLVALVPQDRLDSDTRKVISSLGTKEKGKIAMDFAQLSSIEKKRQDAGPAVLAPATPTATVEVKRNSLPLIFFHKAGCRECSLTREYLAKLKNDFPLLVVEEKDILDRDGTILNQALCSRFDVPTLQQNISPAVFTQAGFLVKENITPSNLGTLLAKTMSLPQDDAWSAVTTEESTAAVAEVEQRFQNLTLPIVLLAGLLDGINPCAFATIIFFLSYLQIARRTPREMLMVGAAFISAVFLAYLAAGLALYQVLASLSDRIAGIQRYMNWLFAALALVAAWLSLRDALRARAGKIDEMTLQLPGFMKDRIRTVIRKGAKARNFVIAAFISGILISFLELACTGQVYAPIIYQIQSGKLDAVLWLCLYNLAFITPLIVIFLLAWGGMRSDRLIQFQKNHTATVKLALALLFLALALFILFGKALLG